jgi:uncharacterized membrane protein
MMLALLILFLLVGAGGLTFTLLESRGRVLPLKLTVSHGVFGVAAIVLLLIWDLDHPGNYFANAAALVFILTATGGLLLFAFRASRQRLPLAVVGLHAAFALAGMTLLGIALLKSA